MLEAKKVADMITGGRALLAVVLAWLGLQFGPPALEAVVWLMLLNWTADSLDGPIARSSRAFHHTWVGDHDLEIDIMVAAGLLLYLAAAHFVAVEAAAVYVLAWATLLWYFGSPVSLRMLVQAPVYGWFIWVANREVPETGWLIFLWIGLALLITWPKFPRQIVPDFLAGIGSLGHAQGLPGGEQEEAGEAHQPSKIKGNGG